MSTENYRLPRALVNQLLNKAQCSPDQEICGLISAGSSAETGRILRCYPVNNVATASATRFALDPEGQIAAMKRMRENDETLFAIYHSHPSAPAYPSPLDLENAGYPELLHLIISLNTRGVLELRGFHLQDKTIHEVSLQLGDSD